MNPKPLLALLLALSLAALSACAAETYQRVPQPDPDVALSDPGKARLYVVRRRQSLWSSWPLLVYDGKREIASLGTGRYLAWEREPGRWLGRLLLDRPRGEGGPTEQLYDVVLEPGEILWVSVGPNARGDTLVVEELEPEEGRALLESSRPAEAR